MAIQLQSEDWNLGFLRHLLLTCLEGRCLNSMSLSQEPALPTEGALHLCDFSLSQQAYMSCPGGRSLRVSLFSLSPEKTLSVGMECRVVFGAGFQSV